MVRVWDEAESQALVFNPLDAVEGPDTPRQVVFDTFSKICTEIATILRIIPVLSAPPVAAMVTTALANVVKTVARA